MGDPDPDGFHASAIGYKQGGGVPSNLGLLQCLNVPYTNLNHLFQEFIKTEQQYWLYFLITTV